MLKLQIAENSRSKNNLTLKVRSASLAKLKPPMPRKKTLTTLHKQNKSVLIPAFNFANSSLLEPTMNLSNSFSPEAKKSTKKIIHTSANPMLATSKLTSSKNIISEKKTKKSNTRVSIRKNMLLDHGFFMKLTSESLNLTQPMISPNFFPCSAKNNIFQKPNQRFYDKVKGLFGKFKDRHEKIIKRTI